MTTAAVLHPAPLPALVGPSVGPTLDDVEAWLAEVRPTLASLRDVGAPPSPGARRWLADVAAEAGRALAMLDHECLEAHTCGTSADVVEWLHTRTAAVADVAATVLARRERAADPSAHPAAA
jgi:hypothetical protein